MKALTTFLTVVNGIITATFLVGAVALIGWYVWQAEFAMQMTMAVGALVLVPCLLLSMNDLKRL